MGTDAFKAALGKDPRITAVVVRRLPWLRQCVGCWLRVFYIRLAGAALDACLLLVPGLPGLDGVEEEVGKAGGLYWSLPGWGHIP